MSANLGIDDFSLGERVRFVRPATVVDGESAATLVEGEVVSVNHAVGTLDVEVATAVPNRPQRLIKRPWELQKVSK